MYIQYVKLRTKGNSESRKKVLKAKSKPTPYTPEEFDTTPMIAEILQTEEIADLQRRVRNVEGRMNEIAQHLRTLMNTPPAAGAGTTVKTEETPL